MSDIAPETPAPELGRAARFLSTAVQNYGDVFRGFRGSGLGIRRGRFGPGICSANPEPRIPDPEPRLYMSSYLRKTVLRHWLSEVPETGVQATASAETSPRMLILAGAVALIVAAASLVCCYSLGVINTYGDSIAHMEGARRLFDSQTPGYPEIGTVWLPLFHILVAPLALSGFLWRTGLGGALVSSAAFVVSGWFIFRLAAGLNQNAAAGVAALTAFVICPDMDALAATPLTESLSIMWFVLMVYGLFRFQQTQQRRALLGAATAAFFGTLTRYDLWYVLPFAALFVLLAGERDSGFGVRGSGFAERASPACCSAKPESPTPKSVSSWLERFKPVALFSVIAGAGPALWVLHNAVRFGNALEFYNGTFSAKAIYAHQIATTGFRYPTDGSFILSAHYYLADLQLIIGVWPLALAVLGLVAWAAETGARRQRAAGLLLLVPLPFYIQSMAHAAVALYVPTLPPGTYYNLRYGLEMLPAIAICCSFLISAHLPLKLRRACAVAVVALVAGQAVSNLWAGVRELPVVKEGLLNSPCRSKAEQMVIRVLRAQYDGSLILMTVGKWPCVMPTLNIPFRQTLTESNRETWLQLPHQVDPAVGWIVRGEGDSTDKMMERYPDAFQDFELVAHEKSPPEDGVWIYRRKSEIRNQKSE